MSKVYKYNLRVYYEDTDVGGVVYYANYLHFIERARTEMIYQQFNLTHKKLKDEYNIIFVVKSCNIKYLKSAKFEDKIVVTTKVIKKTAVRLNLLQEIHRNEELLVSAEIELAIIDSKGLVQKVPQNLLNKI